MKNRGFTLLIGLLVSGILLVIGLSIFSLSEKQLELTTTTRDSQIALYNAESGIECALYWDLQAHDGPLSCAGVPVRAQNTQLVFDTNGGEGCATVNVEQNGTGTTTDSSGYNTCVAIPTQVQRTLEINYGQ